MSYIGKAVRFQHRVATGKAGLKNSGTGERVHVPTPTELVVSDALVLLESFAAGEAEPRLFLLYAKRDVPVLGSDWQSAMTVAFDVPHRGHEDAQHELFWWDALGESLMHIVRAGVTTEGLDEALQAKADEGATLPSGDDLDSAVATANEEEKARKATNGPKKPVLMKPAK